MRGPASAGLYRSVDQRDELEVDFWRTMPAATTAIRSIYSGVRCGEPTFSRIDVPLSFWWPVFFTILEGLVGPASSDSWMESR